MTRSSDPGRDGPGPEDDLPDGLLDDEVLDDAVLDDELGQQLRALLGPAEGLDRRTTHDVDRTLRASSPFAAAFELLGVGWWTLGALFSGDAQDLSSPPRPADRDGEGI